MFSVVTGVDGKEICRLYDLMADDTVAAVKTKIESATNLPAQSLKLGINRRLARDPLPISAYDWEEGDSIIATVTAVPKASAAEVDAPQETPPLEYGYLQIENYARKQRDKARGIVPGPTRWVSLPSGTKVHSYAIDTGPSQRCSGSNVAEEAKPSSRQLVAQPRRSSLKQQQLCKDAAEAFLSPRSAKSDSTAASASDQRQVHFCDEPLPVFPLDVSQQSLPACETSSGYPSPLAQNVIGPLAEWIFVDRDICGFSLCEYSPNDVKFKDFASSHYGYLFLTEMTALESVSQCEQHKIVACQTSSERHNQEEWELDEALKLAGVREVFLQ